MSSQKLKSFVERIERLNEEKKTLNDDIKELYSEVKSDGFDVKVVRKVVQLRKMPEAERAELESIMDTYMNALG